MVMSSILGKSVIWNLTNVQYSSQIFELEAKSLLNVLNSPVTFSMLTHPYFVRAVRWLWYPKQTSLVSLIVSYINFNFLKYFSFLQLNSHCFTKSWLKWMVIPLCFMSVQTVFQKWANETVGWQRLKRERNWTWKKMDKRNVNSENL